MMFTIVLVRGCACEWKFDAEDASMAGRTGRFYVSVVGSTNGFNNRETKARAA